ncbi:MAG: prolyl oligopeptidase family serine peptidase, partial [Terriglobales bacterium]
MPLHSFHPRAACVPAALLSALFCLAATAQQPSHPPVPYSAYDGWNAIRGTALSRDGAWLVYALVPEDGDGQLVARNLKTGAEHRAPRGEDPALTADGRYVVFAVAPTRAARDAAKRKSRGKTPEAVPRGFGVMELSTGALFTVDKVKSYKLAEDGSAYVAYLMEPPKSKPAAADTGDQPAAARKKPELGSDLVIRQLDGGASVTLAAATDFAWAKDGRQLAYAVSAPADAGNGVYLWSAAAGLNAAPRALLRGPGQYQQLAWNDAATQLAFVSDQADPAANPPLYHLYRSDQGAPAQPFTDAALPGGMAVSEHGKLSFSPDGQRLFFGIAPPPRPTPKADPPITQVDLWSWTDAELQPMQKVRAQEEADLSYPAVATLADGRVTALGSPAVPDLMLAADQAHAALGTDVPYRLEASWQGASHDYYAVNLADGSRRLLLRDSHFSATLSPGGNYLLYFDANDNGWHTLRLSDGRRADLTAALGVKFQNELWDQPSPPAPYGVAGWTAGDAAVLLYDRFDIWSAKPDGSGASNLTAGAGRNQHLVFRYQALDPEAKFIPAGPLLLSATDDATEASGIYRLASATEPGAPARLFMRDAAVGRLLKAKNAATVVFTLGRFDQFPNLWVSDAALTAPRQVSDANPQQAAYRWGSSRLIHYTNRDGKRLDAVLITPDGFDPHRQYPLIVYIYERLADTLHHYVPPAPGTNINLTRYVSHGYVVLEPDIVYDTGYPGDSALKCVLPAIETVQAMGFIDPQRIGIQGHSWGGYQVAYMVTRTNKFRAVEAGAVVANMTSAYGGIRWGTGISREAQYEHTQSRIGGPPWQDALLYMENSPLFWVEKVQTPYLTIHNDADDAVPWYQGIEFFTALRRLRKPA